MNISATLDELRAAGNLRCLPPETGAGATDLSSNDYLGLAADSALRESFFAAHSPRELLMSASASRLLGAVQAPYARLEELIARSYGNGREALLFNSGYHANTGIVAALADKHTPIIADKLVHASIIDGIKLAGVPFERFRHNDYDHLERIMAKAHTSYDNVLLVAESVYSMDGDRADLSRLADIKRSYPGTMLYIDEAHAVGVCGPGGLGLCAGEGCLADVDVIVGTLGKALASAGAYAVVSPEVKQFLINKARPLIFSTALPPAVVMWSEHVWRHVLGADTLRANLQELCTSMTRAIPGEPSHIRPLIVGDPAKAMSMSARLLDDGFKVLPIRTPTVPPGTERLRFSLSAAIPMTEIERLTTLLPRLK